MPLHTIINTMVEAGLVAAKRVKALHESSAITVDWKSDGSPVTNADYEANTIICEALGSQHPDIPIISEEHNNSHVAKELPHFMIDPIDGTHGFMHGKSEFTVNLAYIENQIPILGVVVAPDLNEAFYNTPNGEIYFGTGLAGNVNFKKVKVPVFDSHHPIKALLSRSQSYRAKEEAFLLPYGPVEIERISSSIKLAYLAAGRGDIYPRFGTMKEWDIAAGQALILASGGRITCLKHSNEIIFNRTNFEMGPFVATAKGVPLK